MIGYWTRVGESSGMYDDYLMLARAGVSVTLGLGVAFSCRTRDLSTFDFFFLRCKVFGFI